MEFTTTTLDDRSRNITYGGGTWHLGGIPGDEFNGTTTWTSYAGSRATIAFLGQYAQNKFCTLFTPVCPCPGSQISVFSTVAPPIPGTITNASYNIDDGFLTFVTWVRQATVLHQQLFFQSNSLSPTSNHTLTITNLDEKLILDFFNITGIVNNTATTTAPASTAPSVAVLRNSPANHLPIGKIVGSVLGGIFAAVITIIVGVIFLKRKKNRRNQRVNGFPFAREWPMIFLIYDYLVNTFEIHSRLSTYSDTIPSYPSDQKRKKYPANTRNVAREVFTVPPPAYT